MAKWIRFEDAGYSASGRTKLWRVLSNSAVSVWLGTIGWYSGWRKYAFFPNRQLATVLEADCLRDIAKFCEVETSAHREQHVHDRRQDRVETQARS